MMHKTISVYLWKLFAAGVFLCASPAVLMAVDTVISSSPPLETSVRLQPEVPPPALSAPTIASSSPIELPARKLPEGSSITSIVSRIVEHKNLSDIHFIREIMNIPSTSDTSSLNFTYKIPYNLTPVVFSYKINSQVASPSISGHHNELVEIGFENISDTPCIHYTDFSSLFEKEPIESSSHYLPQSPENLDRTYQKDVDSEHYITLNISTTEACAADIHLLMYKKTSSNK